MTPEERAAFLADVHIGVLSVAAVDRGPLTVPVWYQYEPGGLVSFTTAGTSPKAARLRAARRCSLCAQTETAPYQYVSVEGPIVAIDDPADPAERRAMAHRYLGAEFGDLYLEATAADAATSVTFRMRPERWISVDYGKQFG